MRQRLVVHGQVQGVGYRWAMVQQAQRLGLRGWVRNRRDGTVEAQAAGSAEAVQALIAWAQQGPDGARVTRLECAPPDAGEADEPLPADFSQRPSV